MIRHSKSFRPNLFVSSFFSFILLSTVYVLPSPGARAASPARVCFRDQCIAVEVADTNAARIRGLQGRASMPDENGMLFVFPNEDVYDFWMKDTLMGLDLIWLDGTRQVMDLKEAVPPCRQDPCPLYRPSHKALYVLEINAGVARKMGLRIGDRVEFKE